MASYYNLPQAPGKYQEAVIQAGGNIYDDVEKHRSALHGYVCGIPVIPFAYLVCGYMVFEGLILILDVSEKGPFSETETGYLEVVAWGDIVSALIGAMGIWFSHNLAGVGWRDTSKSHSTIATLGSGSVLAWRSLVCLSFAPWAGHLLAFSIPDGDRVFAYGWILGYIALSIFLVYVLAMAFRQAVSDGKLFQQHLDAQAQHERQQLLTSANNHRQENRDLSYHDQTGEDLNYHEVEPELFGFLPLAETVTIYSIVIAVACLWCFFHLLDTGHTSGGWAFFSQTPKVAETFWLEVFLWPLSFLCALIGMSGASSFSGSGFLDEKPALSSLLMFLVGSMLRFALLCGILERRSQVRLVLDQRLDRLLHGLNRCSELLHTGGEQVHLGSLLVTLQLVLLELLGAPSIVCRLGCCLFLELRDHGLDHADHLAEGVRA